MGKPAARVGDAGTPPHTPLLPGPGSPTVLIGRRRAWRTNVDKSECMAPLTPASPHGREICYLGSLSVMVNHRMAVRQGDILIGMGGPNPVALGEATVLIGDIGFGLADPARMAEFCKDFEKLAMDWRTLTPGQREARLEAIVNKQLGKSGLPTQYVRGDPNVLRRNAFYHHPSGTIVISEKVLQSPRLSLAAGKILANRVYHEARHAEQWYLMARQRAGLGATAGQIQARMGIPPNVAASAYANPLTGTSAAGNLGSASWRSVYGPGNQYRNWVLNNINTQYPAYRALVEEQDAWNTGDSLPCGR